MGGFDNSDEFEPVSISAFVPPRPGGGNSRSPPSNTHTHRIPPTVDHFITNTFLDYLGPRHEGKPYSDYPRRNDIPYLTAPPLPSNPLISLFLFFFLVDARVCWYLRHPAPRRIHVRHSAACPPGHRCHLDPLVSHHQAQELPLGLSQLLPRYRCWLPGL